MSDGISQMAREEKARKRREREKAEKPSLTETIEWARGVSWVYSSKFQRLVKAAEFEQKFTSKEWCIDGDDYERCPCCRPFVDRIEELERQIQTLRRQLDAVGKEKAELERETKTAWGVGAEHVGTINKLRSQLAEKERELELIKKKAIPVAQAKLRNIDMALSYPRELLKLCGCVEDPAPTEAEVEKVAEKLYYKSRKWPGRPKWEYEHPHEQDDWRGLARHVLERGYRPK